MPLGDIRDGIPYIVPAVTESAVWTRMSMRAGEEPMSWRTSSYSAENGCCVEVAADTEVIAIRDSKNPEQAVLRVRPAAWSAFVAGVKAGRIVAPLAGA